MHKHLTTMFFLLLFAAVTSASAQTAMGKKIETLKDTFGAPSFGLQYATETTKMISITFSVQGSQLVGGNSDFISPARWAIVNIESQEILTSWADLPSTGAVVMPSSSQAFTLAVSDPSEIDVVAKSLSKSALVISLKGNTTTVYLDIHELCKVAPEHFINLDTFATGCNK